MGTVLAFPDGFLEAPRCGPDASSRVYLDDIEPPLHLLRAMEPQVMQAFEGLESALGTIEKIGALLPPGHFKDQFNRDRDAIVAQLKFAIGRITYK